MGAKPTPPPTITGIAFFLSETNVFPSGPNISNLSPGTFSDRILVISPKIL